MSIIRRLERRSAPEWGNSDPPPNGSLGGNPTGVRVSESTALQITAVYGSVGVIADSLATLPWRLFSSEDPATRRRLPLPQLLQQPYSEISRMDWITQYAMSMALRGNFYGQIVARDRDFYPEQIKPWHPDRVSVRRGVGGAPEYRFGGKVVPVDDVFHVRYLTTPGSLVGLNPIECLQTPLGLALAQEAYGADYFAHDASASVVISTKDDLDPDETLAMARSFQAAHSGPGRWHMPAVVTGDADVKMISITPQDSQFLENRAYSGADISGKVFRVPPHMIGIVDRSTSWGTGIEQQEMGFVRNTLRGYIDRLEEALTVHRPDQQHVRFDLKDRLRADSLQRAQTHSLGVLGGWLCADDVRADEDMPPLPNGAGKNYMVPINSELLAQALKDLAAKPVAEQAPPPQD